MVSLKDIAIKCNVSVATVSKALNDHSDIAEETKKRIEQAAASMGYVPNAAAKTLKTARTKNIGVLFTDLGGSGLTHDYFSHVLDSFKRNIEKHGYDLTFISSNHEAFGRMSYLDHVRFRRFDGVCIANVDFKEPKVYELIASDIPLITIDYVFNGTLSVCSDNVKGMTDLMEHIISLGHRKIAYIHGENSAVTQKRVATFYKVCEENGIEVPDIYVRPSKYRNFDDAYTKTMQLLELKNPPTCIVYSDDYAAFGGMMAIDEKGLSIPDDISIAGYDGVRLGRHIHPKLTTIRQDTELIGEIAADKLISLIENPKTMIVDQTIIPGSLFAGESVGKPRA